jgi:hypothetical protein
MRLVMNEPVIGAVTAAPPAAAPVAGWSHLRTRRPVPLVAAVAPIAPVVTTPAAVEVLVVVAFGGAAVVGTMPPAPVDNAFGNNGAPVVNSTPAIIPNHTIIISMIPLPPQHGYSNGVAYESRRK